MTSKGKSTHSASLGSLAPIGSQKPLWPPRRRCHCLHSNYMLNRGYAYATIISSKYHGQTLLSHLASLYHHSTSLATKTEQRRSHPQRRHLHRKRIDPFRPNPCLEPSTLDRTRLPSALRSPV